MWIETGCVAFGFGDHVKFIRQQWRMWIETAGHVGLLGKRSLIHSPAMANVD